MASMKDLRSQRQNLLFYGHTRNPDGSWKTRLQIMESSEYQAIQAQIEEKERISKAKSFVLPDLTCNTATAHMLQYVWKHGMVASNDFSREHELYRSKGKSGRQVYGRHKMFDRFLGHILERVDIANAKGGKFYYRWIGPKTKAEWIEKIPVRRRKAWILYLEDKIDSLSSDERDWYAALCDRHALIKLMAPAQVDAWFQELERKLADDNLSSIEQEWLEVLRAA